MSPNLQGGKWTDDAKAMKFIFKTLGQGVVAKGKQIWKKLAGKQEKTPFHVGSFDNLRTPVEDLSNIGGLSLGGSGKRKSFSQKPTEGRKRKISEKMKQRNKVVKAVMEQTGMSLPQASKYVKEQNLF